MTREVVTVPPDALLKEVDVRPEGHAFLRRR